MSVFIEVLYKFECDFCEKKFEVAHSRIHPDGAGNSVDEGYLHAIPNHWSVSIKGVACPDCLKKIRLFQS